MRLTSIDIDNFRCHKHCHIDFNDRLTVIVGTNGAGKTSILEAARIAINRGCDSIQNDDVRTEWYEVGSVIDVQPQYPSIITANGIINESDIDENDNGKENIDKEEIDKENIQWSRAKCF
jgi:predicted ATP-binding protein involved in virulence